MLGDGTPEAELVLPRQTRCHVIDDNYGPQLWPGSPGDRAAADADQPGASRAAGGP